MNLSLLPHLEQVKVILTATEQAIKTAISAYTRSKRTRAGRHKTLRPCPLCGCELGAEELRRHLPSCRRAKKAVEQSGHT